MVFTLSETCFFEEDIKKSRFQAIAAPIANEQAAKEFLALHADATTTHQCWAWKLGHQSRINDDGEPSGTAGRPILASIEGNDLSNVIVLVNRWYGGVKLGTGGLVRAYGGCAGQCLMLAEKTPIIEYKTAIFNCTFSEWAILQYEFSQANISFKEDYIAQGVAVTVELQVHQIDHFKQRIQDLSRGQSVLKLLEEDEA